jgi:hypothetical protein
MIDPITLIVASSINSNVEDFKSKMSGKELNINKKSEIAREENFLFFIAYFDETDNLVFSHSRILYAAYIPC